MVHMEIQESKSRHRIIEIRISPFHNQNMRNKDGVHKGNAGLNTMLQLNMNKTYYFIKKTDIRLATKIDPSTSCAPFDMQWSWLGSWGK